MDVLTRMPTEDESDLFHSFMMADLEFATDFCPDLPPPTLAADPNPASGPARLQIPDSFRQFARLDSLDLQQDGTPPGFTDCLESPSIAAALFNLSSETSMDLDNKFPYPDTFKSYTQLLTDVGSDKALTDMFNSNTANSARSSSQQPQQPAFGHAQTPAVTSSSEDALLDCMTTNGFGQDSALPTPSAATSFHKPNGFSAYHDGQGSNLPSAAVSTCPSPLSYSPYASFPHPSQPDCHPGLLHNPPGIRCHAKDRTLTPSPPPMIQTSQLNPPSSSPHPSALEPLLSPSIDAMDMYNAQMLDPHYSSFSSPWEVQQHDGDDIRRQSESGSSSLHPSRNWQPVAQRKAVKRALSRSRTTQAGVPPVATTPFAAINDAAFFPSLPAISTSLPKAFLPVPGLQEQPSEDTSQETPTHAAANNAQTEWLRIQMTKLMSSSPSCAPVRLRNLMNSPRRASSQPNSPSFRTQATRSKPSTPRSRPGTPRVSTPRARTPRGMSNKLGGQASAPTPFTPSRLGSAVANPVAQRTKVARSQNTDVSSSVISQSAFEMEHRRSPFKPPRASDVFASVLSQHQQQQQQQQQQQVVVQQPLQQRPAAGNIKVGTVEDEVVREKAAWEMYMGMMDVDIGMEHSVQDGRPGQGQLQPGSMAHRQPQQQQRLLQDNGTTSTPAASDSHSRPHSSNSNRSSSSPVQVPSLEQVLEQLSGSCVAIEADGRLLQLQRSFSAGLSSEALDRILLALAHHPVLEVVYFPDCPMVLGEAQVKLLAAALQQGRIWALSLGEGGSMTAAGWHTLANRLQNSALAYLYVSPSTQATIPPAARTQIRDALHNNRRNTPCRDSTLLEHMQRMTPANAILQQQEHLPLQQQQPQPPVPAGFGDAMPTNLHGLSLSGSLGPARQQSPDTGSDGSSHKVSVMPPAPCGGPHPASNLTSPSSASPEATMVNGMPHGDRSLTCGGQAPNAAGNCSQSSASASLDDLSDTANKRSPGSSDGPSFADLVSVGLVQPGHYQLSVGAVRSVNVMVLPKGVIQWEGAEYQSLSAFALAVLQRSNAARVSCDGWKEVCLHGISLETLRQHYVERHC